MQTQQRTVGKCVIILDYLNLIISFKASRATEKQLIGEEILMWVAKLKNNQPKSNRKSFGEFHQSINVPTSLAKEGKAEGCDTLHVGWDWG